jgi:hypothetical protein
MPTEGPNITIESGHFDWNAGRGYERPSPRPGEGGPWGGPPPPEPDPAGLDWSRPPDMVDIDLTPIMTAVPAPGLDIQNLRPGRTVAVNGPNPDRQTAREFLGQTPPLTLDYIRGLQDMVYAVGANADGTLPPEERVNMVNGTAKFAGYEIKLRAEAVDAIRALLAVEVCRVLEEEQTRVIASVQQLQSTPNTATAEDVPAVPGPPQQVGTPEASGEGAVQ